MNKQADRVLELVKARGVPDRKIRRELAETCGIAYQSVYGWFTGDTKSIEAAHLAKVAKRYGGNLEYLVSGIGPLLSDERIYTDGGSRNDRTTLNAGTNNLDEDQGSDFGDEVEIKFRGIPVVGTAQFGDEGFFEELQYPVGHGDGFVDFPSRDASAYALRGNGNSMSPRFRHGEYIIVEPGTEVHPGDEVMVRMRDGRVMGKVYAYQRDGMAYFDSINADHAQISVQVEQIEKMHFIAGVAKRSLYRPPR
ncbi:MAG TPA: S24 family peptidase [Moraxellaceae bacterium]|nr:S24 family peptidase [Moraxellaceae bacterium]